VPRSPFRPFVSQPLNAGKVQIFGPGVEPGVKANKPNHFTIDCSEAGIGKHRAGCGGRNFVSVQVVDVV